MYINRVKLFLFTAFLSTKVLCAQEFKQFSFRNLTVNDGLSQNSVVSITQDSIGYIWFATQDGLNKYDGRNFTYYDKQFQDITRATYSQLGQIYTDSFGDFWIYSLNGWLERYNYKTKQFEALIEISEVTKIFRYNKEKLWAGTLNNGLFEVDISTKNSKKIFPKILKAKSVFDILTIGESYLLATSNGIYTIEKDKISSDFSSENIPISNLTIQNNSLIAGSYGKGVLCYDLITKKAINSLSNLFLRDLNVQDILVDSKSRLWITTYGDGVFMKLPKSNLIKHFEANKEDPYALHYNDVLDVFEDYTGVIWLGTDGSGLSYYDETLAKFNVMTNSQTTANVHVDVIRSIAVSEDEVWLGTSGKGLTKLSRKNEDEAYTFTRQNSNLASDRVMSLYLHNNELWIGHQGAGLQIFNANRFRTISQLSEKTIWKIASDNSNHIWIATRNSGLYKLDRGGNIINNWSQENTILPTNNIRTVAFNEEASLVYIGTDNDGVFILNQKDNHISPIEGLKNATKSLLFDKDKLYTGTNGDGIKILNTKSNSITHITKENGLPNEVIYGILKDNNEHIWMSSNRGISKIEINDSDTKITNYSNYDGLQAFEFNTGAYFKAQDGTLFFGGLEGFNWFIPSQLQLNTAKPRTIISNVELFNQPIEENLTTFKHNENTLTFTFSSLQFSQPERNLYQYKLAPYDKDWIVSTNTNLAHYTNLEPDNYSFYVKSSNYDGLWSNDVANYTFIIQKPWYKTNLAYLSYFLLLLLSIYAIYSYFKFKWKLETQVRLEHAETERLMQLDEFKTKLYTNISHEFRTPLTLISGPIDKQLASKTLKEEDKKELQLVKQNAMRLLGLVNQMMDLSLIDAGQIKLKVEQGNLGIIFKQLVSAFQYKANEKDINITASIDDLDNCWFDRDILEKIGSNLLSNAIKYAPEKTQVYFTAQEQNDQLQLSIINQNDQVKADKLGQLFERFYQNNETSEGIGVGLALVKDLVTLSKGNILANTLDDHKIQFSVSLPIKKSDFLDFELSEIQEDTSPTETKTIENKKQPTIIVIDDEKDILDFVASIFKDTYNVIKTTKSTKALELIRKELPDLVISDIMMPEIDGIELCNQLKKDSLTSHIPIILLTAKVTQDQQREGLETGADAYVTKPFNADILKVRVKKLIETREQLKQRFNEQPILTKALEVTSVEAEFMQRLKAVLEEHLVDPEFTSDAFSKHMLMSRTQLHRKLKATVGMTTSEFIRSQRLLLARDLFKKQKNTISEVAYLVGFNSVSYFIKCFKNSYSETPAQYVDKHNP